jgi:hypothetical protein
VKLVSNPVVAEFLHQRDVRFGTVRGLGEVRSDLRRPPEHQAALETGVGARIVASYGGGQGCGVFNIVLGAGVICL